MKKKCRKCGGGGIKLYSRSAQNPYGDPCSACALPELHIIASSLVPPNTIIVLTAAGNIGAIFKVEDNADDNQRECTDKRR